jgi:hypothetical protein
MHIKGGSWEDTQRWGTGIGWAVAGMVRVYATYHFSPFIGTFDAERTHLAMWGNEIVEAVLPWIVSAIRGLQMALHTDDFRAALQSLTTICCLMSMLEIEALTMQRALL